MTDEPDDVSAPRPPHDAPEGASTAPPTEDDVTKPEEAGRAVEPDSPMKDPAVAMDEESPSEVRKTFIVLMTLGGILLLLPRQYVSAGILFVVAIVFTVIHLRKARSGT